MSLRHFITSVSLLLALLAPEVRAQLQCDPSVVDFGRRAENQVFTAQATLTNVMPGPVKILSVRGDSGSLTADAAILALAPGESTTLTVRIESGGLEGKFQHRVDVAIAEGAGAALTVDITVCRYPDWVVEPAQLIFAPSSREAAATSELKVTHVGAYQPGITSITSGSPFLAITTEESVGNTVTYLVRKLPSAPVGALNSDIRVATDDPTAPLLDVPVSAYVTGEKK
jgi:hypothetical protein